MNESIPSCYFLHPSNHHERFKEIAADRALSYLRCRLTTNKGNNVILEDRHQVLGPTGPV